MGNLMENNSFVFKDNQHGEAKFRLITLLFQSTAAMWRIDSFTMTRCQHCATLFKWSNWICTALYLNLIFTSFLTAVHAYTRRHTHTHTHAHLIVNLIIKHNSIVAANRVFPCQVQLGVHGRRRRVCFSRSLLRQPSVITYDVMWNALGYSSCTCSRSTSCDRNNSRGCLSTA